MACPLIPATETQLIEINSILSIDEERHKRILEVFKDWIKSEPHLPNDIDEHFLSNYLRLCKDDLVKAKRKFETNIISRGALFYLSNETFLTTKDFRENLLTRSCVMSPKLTKDGYRIIIASFPKLAINFNLQNIVKLMSVISDVTFFEDKAAGMIIIGDYSNFSIELTSKLDLVVAARVTNYIINTIPTRLQKYHILSAPSIAKPFIAVIKAAVSEKLRNRVLFHDDVASLRSYFTEDVLPADYGGSLPSMDELANDWERYFLENEDYKVKLKKLRLTAPVPKDKHHLDPGYGFGTDGTFRNLQVD